MQVRFVAYKDPDAVLDYVMDWSAWLGNDTIIASAWEINDGEALDEGDTFAIDDSSSDDTTATVWLSGGVVNTGYNVTNRIMTAATRTEDRTIRVKVLSR